MATPLSFHRHARNALDQAIGESYASLSDDASARAAFVALVDRARARSTLLRPGGAAVAAVQALRNLARHHTDHRAAAATWSGGDNGVHALVHALALHVLARYPVPRFMANAWFGGEGLPLRIERRWFVEHASGRRFRDVADVPVRLTRRMEHLLLTSPDHVSPRTAIRRAEILGLGGPQALVDAVLATPLASDFDHADFWRTALRFFAVHWDELGPRRIGPIVDFLYAVRIRSAEVATPDGVVERPPPHPDFSLAGRTPRSLARLVDAWHAELGRGRATGRTWRASGLRSFEFATPPASAGDPPVRWRIVEVTDSRELFAEGRSLGHCVASYETRCVAGRSSIWSLRRQAGDEPPVRRFTIDVDPRTATIVQIRGRANRRVDGVPARLIAAWAEQERLATDPHA